MLAAIKANGKLVGFMIRYALKETVPKVWFYHNVNKASIRRTTLRSLTKYTVYEFAVAANSSKGAGPYCPSVEQRTLQDGLYIAALSFV